MTGLSIVVLLAAVIVAVVVIAIVLWRQGHPEETARHASRVDDPRDDKMPRAPGSNPGGPGQGGQHVLGPGEISPGDPDSR